MRLILSTLLLAFALTGLTACDDGGGGGGGEKQEYADPATTTVKVAFRDSSVPPEYHRSWQLTLDQESIRLVVDSYGDVLSDETLPMPALEWERFTADLPAAVAELGEPAPGQEGCSGGTGLGFEIDGSLSRTLDLDNCANDPNLAITDEILALVAPFTHRVDLAGATATD